MEDKFSARMGASNIDQKLSGVLLVEHLAALGVVLMAVGWLALLMMTYQFVERLNIRFKVKLQMFTMLFL